MFTKTLQSLTVGTAAAVLMLSGTAFSAPPVDDTGTLNWQPNQVTDMVAPGSGEFVLEVAFNADLTTPMLSDTDETANPENTEQMWFLTAAYSGKAFNAGNADLDQGADSVNDGQPGDYKVLELLKMTSASDTGQDGVVDGMKLEQLAVMFWVEEATLVTAANAQAYGVDLGSTAFDANGLLNGAASTSTSTFGGSADATNDAWVMGVLGA